MAEGTQHDRRNRARKVLIDLAVIGVVGLLLAVIGPFGSFAMPFVWRLIYWLGLAYVGYFCFRPLGGLVRGIAARLDLPEWPLWIPGCLIATIPLSMVVWMVDKGARLPSLELAFTTYVRVLVIGAAVTVLFFILERREAPPAASVSGATLKVQTAVRPTPARFVDRLPPALGSDLIALEMEDHYVRAHTMLGSDLVLMRMRDAVAELDGLEGEQVHRSWWVARDAITGVKRDGRNVRLELETGLEAPIARARLAELKQAGWL